MGSATVLTSERMKTTSPPRKDVPCDFCCRILVALAVGFLRPWMLLDYGTLGAVVVVMIWFGFGRWARLCMAYALV